MSKLSALSRVGQLRVSSCVLAVLAIIVFEAFLHDYGLYNYDHIPKESIPNALFKAVSPSLKKQPDMPECKYDHILSSTKSLQNWQVPKKFDGFSPKGLVNGSFTPHDCNPLFSVAILVPYRNRPKQLSIFMPYMHNFLRKQNIHYKMFLIEQDDNKRWNKGLLFNIGAQEAMAEGFPCLLLHDVDMLPLKDGDLQACFHQPRHVSASLDKFRFVLPYTYLVGGVLAITGDHYRLVNGFSNTFFDWGGEDDDFAYRILDNNLEILRLGPSETSYTMIPHEQAPYGGGHARGAAAAALDGLRDARARAASITTTHHLLYTRIAVKVR